MKPIYKPKGAAAEYGDYAVNIYAGCPHHIKDSLRAEMAKQ